MPMTFLAATPGITAPCVFDGPINGCLFRAWVTEFLVPVLRPGDIVVLDNLGSTRAPPFAVRVRRHACTIARGAVAAVMRDGFKPAPARFDTEQRDRQDQHNEQTDHERQHACHAAPRRTSPSANTST
jgi:hypothetical protein